MMHSAFCVLPMNFILNSCEIAVSLFSDKSQYISYPCLKWIELLQGACVILPLIRSVLVNYNLYFYCRTQHE